jgi:hypothetical protein
LQYPTEKIEPGKIRLLALFENALTLWIRVARFFMAEHTKRVKIYQMRVKYLYQMIVKYLYQIAIKFTKRP